MELLKSNIDTLKKTSSELPVSPGVYQFLNKEGKIIYVGKAKDLKKRVSSYFSNSSKDGKTTRLVEKISEIRHIIVDSEQDALLLENNLIKEYQPRYNVLLKDDKTYPWICIKNEPFSRIFPTRNRIEDGSEYYGPFTSGRLMKLIQDLIRQLFYIRNCKFSLTQQNINSGKFKVCLEFHIGNCKGPCIGNYDIDEYNQQLISIRKILKGNISSVLDYMKNLMNQYAGDFYYEKAEEIKQKIILLERFQSRSTIVSEKLDNMDVYSFVDKGEYVYVNFLKVSGGSVIQSHSVELKRKLEESEQDLLLLAIIEIRKKLFSTSNTILIPHTIDYKLDNVKYIIPKKGDKKLLLDLSHRNSSLFAIQRERERAEIKDKNPVYRLMRKIMEDFHLKNFPVQIECFDNSNLMGTFPVASCVVFRHLKPSKKDYRHFNIKTVIGPDDFKSMREIVSRRYKRLVEEGKSLPQLVVIDGGKGQLSSAYESLKQLGLEKEIALIGIAKRLEEIYFPNDSVPIYLDKNSESLKVIQRLRNEAHRFAVTFHRDKRSNSFTKSDLSNIKGLGDESVKKLLINFKSLSRIKQANTTEIAKIIGLKKAQILNNYLIKD